MAYKAYVLKKEFKIYKKEEDHEVFIKEKSYQVNHSPELKEPDDVYLVYYNPSSTNYQTARARMKLGNEKATYLISYFGQYVRHNNMKEFFKEIPPALVNTINDKYFKIDEKKFDAFKNED